MQFFDLCLSISIKIQEITLSNISPVEFTGNVDVVHEALDVQRQVRGVGAHQLLELLALLVQSHQRPGPRPDVQLVLFPELLAEVVDQDVVEALPAEL